MGRSFWAVSEPISFASHRVVLAESDVISRRRLEEGLTMDGHDVTSVVGPNQLLYLLSTLQDNGPKPDVVIVDVTMGDGNTWEVLRTCRHDLGDALLILLSPPQPPGAFDDLTPFVVFTRPFSTDDVRTAALNAPLSRKLRQAARAVLEGKSVSTSTPPAAKSA
jgi:CheY-like chemotaxis protein